MRKMFLLPVLCTLVSLAGCWDYNEMNMQEIVLVAAVDGTHDGITLTVSCAPRISGEKGQVYTSRGESFYTAVRELSERTDKKMYWGHISAILIGEEALPLVDTVFDTLVRAEDVHLDIVPIVVSGERAGAFAREGSDLVLTFANEKNSKRRRAPNLQKLYRERDEFRAYVIPRLTKDALGLRLAGGVVVGENGERMNLTPDEMLLLDLLTHDGEGGYLPTVVTENGTSASFEILGNTREKEVCDGKEIFTVKLTLSPGEIRGDGDLLNLALTTEQYLEESFLTFTTKVKKHGLSGILGKSAEGHVKAEVKISNATGEI